MSMICDNPRCPHHVQLRGLPGNVPTVRVEVPGPGPHQVTLREVRRHPYVSRFFGPREVLFYLCDTCHSAVEMTKRP